MERKWDTVHEGGLNKDPGVRNNERESGIVNRTSWLVKTHEPRKISYDPKCQL